MSTTVKVTAGYLVVVDGEQRSGGEVVEVDDDLAATWLRRGWVEPAPRPAARRRNK